MGLLINLFVSNEYLNVPRFQQLFYKLIENKRKRNNSAPALSENNIKLKSFLHSIVKQDQAEIEVPSTQK